MSENQEFRPSKLQELIVYLIDDLNERELGKIELAKLIYHIDTEFKRLFGETLTEEEYIREPYGPVPVHFYDALSALYGHEVKQEFRPPKWSQWGKHSQLAWHERRFEPAFSDVELAVLARVLDKIGSMSVIELERLAYETEPMLAMIKQEAKENNGQPLRKHPIDMSLIKRNVRINRWRNTKKPYETDSEYRRFIDSQRKNFRKYLDSNM